MFLGVIFMKSFRSYKAPQVEITPVPYVEEFNPHSYLSNKIVQFCSPTLLNHRFGNCKMFTDGTIMNEYEYEDDFLVFMDKSHISFEPELFDYSESDQEYNDDTPAYTINNYSTHEEALKFKSIMWVDNNHEYSQPLDSFNNNIEFSPSNKYEMISVRTYGPRNIAIGQLSNKLVAMGFIVVINTSDHIIPKNELLLFLKQNNNAGVFNYFGDQAGISSTLRDQYKAPHFGFNQPTTLTSKQHIQPPSTSSKKPKTSPQVKKKDPVITPPKTSSKPQVTKATKPTPKPIIKKMKGK